MWLFLASLLMGSPEPAPAPSADRPGDQSAIAPPAADRSPGAAATSPAPATPTGSTNLAGPTTQTVTGPPAIILTPAPRLEPATPVAVPKGPVPRTSAIQSIPFEIRFGALLQVQYLGVATDGHVFRRLSDMAAPLTPLPPTAPSTPSLDESTLILRRARLSAGGIVATPRLGYFVELDAAQGNVALLEYRMRLELGRGLALNVGQMRVPFSRSWAIREDRLLFPERSIATEQFRYDYDIGISLDGAWLADRLALTLGGFNGGGRLLARNDNLDPMLVLRVEGRPAGTAAAAPIEGPADPPESASVVLGAALAADYVPTPPTYGYLSGEPQPPRQLVVDPNDDGLPPGITVFEAEIDAKATLHGFAAEAEGYYRHEAWHDIPLLQPASTTPFAPRTNYAGFFFQGFQSFSWRELVAGARVSFTGLSPLSPGYQRYDQHSCLTSSGVSYACNLPYSDGQWEVSAAVVKKLIPRLLQVSGMYSLLYWTSRGAPAPADPVEQRAIVALQLAY